MKTNLVKLGNNLVMMKEQLNQNQKPTNKQKRLLQDRPQIIYDENRNLVHCSSQLINEENLNLVHVSLQLSS
jgi:hypothetical protein